MFYFLTVQFSRINFFLLFSTSFKVSRDIFYHHSFYLSSTFFHFFISFFVLVCNFLLGSYELSLYTLFITCQAFFKNFFILIKNGEGGIWTHAPLLTTYPLSRRAPSTTWVLLQMLYTKLIWRRGWDSNPRPLSESLVFKTSSLNHSDTSP